MSAFLSFSDAKWTWWKSRYPKNAFKKRSIGTAPLSSEKLARRLEDIIENVRAVLHYTEGMDLVAFVEDRKTYDAVERCLQRISEAAVRLGDEALVLVPAQPCRDIRALGNRLRHEYEAIRQDRLWDIIEKDLPSLCVACEDALRRLRQG